MTKHNPQRTNQSTPPPHHFPMYQQGLRPEVEVLDWGYYMQWEMQQNIIWTGWAPFNMVAPWLYSYLISVHSSTSQSITSLKNSNIAQLGLKWRGLILIFGRFSETTKHVQKQTLKKLLKLSSSRKEVVYHFIRVPHISSTKESYRLAISEEQNELKLFSIAKGASKEGSVRCGDKNGSAGGRCWWYVR